MLSPPPLAAALLAILTVAGPSRPAAAYTPAQAKASATVTLVRSDYADCSAGCADWIALTGKIDASTPARFDGVLARIGRVNVPVLIDSPGGSVAAAMAIGHIIRARKMNVAVACTTIRDCAASDHGCAARLRAGERPGLVTGGTGVCASACVLILAAGVERSVGPFTLVGVHQMTAQRTLRRVMNYFRVVRRMVNGHPVEVSRTLVRTEPLSSRTLTGAAPDTAYSEVDRYLLRLGIAESIMPLMRSAPPSGIHWLTRSEIDATRIATDTTDARAVVAQAAEAAPKPSGVEAPAFPAQARPSARPAASAPSPVAACQPAGTTSGSDVAYQLRRSASAAVPVQGLAALSWLAAPASSHPAEADATCSAALFVGAANLSLTIVTGPASGGSIEIDINVTPDASRFGPATHLTAHVSGRPESPVAVMPGLDPTHYGGAFRLGLATRDGGFDGATLDLDLSDAEGRHLVLSIPIEGPLAAILDRPGPTTAGAPSPPPDVDATASWTLLHEGASPPQPGAVSLLGSVVVPSAGLQMSLQGGLAASGRMGGVVLTVGAVPDIARFGPVTDLAVKPVEAADGRTALFGAVRRRPDGDYDVTLASPAPPPPDATLGFTLTDPRGRRLDIAVSLPHALRDLLAAARPAS